MALVMKFGGTSVGSAEAREQQAPGGKSRIDDSFQHGVECGECDVAARLLNRRERHGEQGGEAHVVKADDSEVYSKGAKNTPLTPVSI